MTTINDRNLRKARRAGRTASTLGLAFLGAAGGSWFVIRQQLLAESITVHPDVKSLAGRKVGDPVTAYAQADIVNKHLLSQTEGKPFAELPMDDPAREAALMAATVRSSLLTSVLSFGLSGLAAGAGVTALVAGRGLKKVAASGE
ncbi:MAG: hypothetical protein ACTH1D_06675 [Mycobacteriaceae bacterium]|uniref:hypothetical protein n=1 Tax=Corynebacterium sp. TaxID=1720 RepID=UPI003F9B2383